MGIISSNWLIILSGFVGIGLLVYNLVRGVRRGLEMRQLALEGVTHTAHIVDKRTIHRRKTTYILTYSYQTADGQTFQHSPLVSSDLWHSVQVGDAIEIVYLPTRPHISALKRDVDLARQALR